MSTARCETFDIASFEAAVDLRGSEGESGFDQITLWSDENQAGDQAIFTKPGQAVRMSINISYYGKRRLRIMPAWNRPVGGKPCVRDESVLRFGADIAKAAAGSAASPMQPSR